MRTTNLFVELLVIGFGAASWVGLLAMALFGVPPLSVALSAEALVAATPLVYLLGILMDRAADWTFEKLWEEKLLAAKTGGKLFSSVEEYYECRRYILNHSPALAKELEYGRSRLRICRGWTLDAALAAVALNVFIWVKLSAGAVACRLSLFGTAGCLLLAWGSQRAWRSLASKQYDKIARQGKYLMDRDATVPPPATSQV